MHLLILSDPQRSRTSNDRLPGLGCNSLVGPNYATTDLRLNRKLHIGERLRVELVAESFSLLNPDNQHVLITQDGFQSNAAQFAQADKRIGINIFPAQYRIPRSPLRTTDAYAPRQIQLALKLTF
jgi:hypothetical protein